MAVTDKEQKWRNRFGDNLRNIMKERDVTQLGLACDIDKDTKAISDYVNGKRTPSAYVIFEMAKLLNVTPNSLCGWYDET